MIKPFIGDFKPGQLFGQNFNNYYQSEGLKGHAGIDFPMPNGTPILAACAGTVIYISKDIKKGEGVSIRSDETFMAGGQPCKMSCIYWHLKDGSISVKVGDKVPAGTQIGLSNNTGQTTGPHLHFGLFPLALDGTHELYLNNGYKGAVNPFPYCDWLSSEVSFSHTWKVSKDKLKQFQSTHGLVPDGIVGPKTQAIIDSLI